MKINITILNTIFGLLGLLIIWIGTHSFIGLLGGFIAGIHIKLNEN